MTSEPFEDYLEQAIGLIDGLKGQKQKITKLASEILRCVREDRQVIAFGNGGSAANASHFVADLVKGPPGPSDSHPRAICLTDNISSMTAMANDFSYADIFSEQLKVFCRKGDLVVAISCSGNSPNVLNGVKTAREAGATTFGLCAFDGGKLADMVDTAIITPTRNMLIAEDVHRLILHLVPFLVRKNGPRKDVQ